MQKMKAGSLPQPGRMFDKLSCCLTSRNAPEFYALRDALLAWADQRSHSCRATRHSRLRPSPHTPGRVNLGLANIAASVICGHPRAIARGGPHRQFTSRENLLRGYGRPNAREVSMRASRSTTAYERLPWPQGPALAQFHLDPALHVRRGFQIADTDERFFATRTEPARAAPTEISFGPFRLLPTQFLL